MELNVIGRNLAVSERFHDYVQEKVAKVEALGDKAQSLDVKVSAQEHAQKADSAITVELTVKCKGPVVRAEASAADKFAAFDVAYGKLVVRLRRARDRKKIHQGRHAPRANALPAFRLPADAALADDPGTGQFPHEAAKAQAPEDGAGADGEIFTTDGTAGTGEEFSPVLIRRKLFQGVPMSVDDAVDNMELVGHDFYLFLDKDSGATSVVYRRKGWSYGVISLDEELESSEVEAGEVPYRTVGVAAS